MAASGGPTGDLVPSRQRAGEAEHRSSEEECVAVVVGCGTHVVPVRGQYS